MMYVSANEKAVSLNLHRYTEDEQEAASMKNFSPGLANLGRVGALFPTLFCSQNTVQLMT
jgi:hypothetical protein